VEFGTPWDLIQANGPFRELVKQSGEENTLVEVSLSTSQMGANQTDCLSLLETCTRTESESRKYLDAFAPLIEVMDPTLESLHGGSLEASLKRCKAD
jgi:hypothetical protein